MTRDEEIRSHVKNQRDPSGRRKRNRGKIMTGIRFEFSMELRKRQSKGEGDAEEFPA
jgi:hypothetical protein